MASVTGKLIKYPKLIFTFSPDISDKQHNFNRKSRENSDNLNSAYDFDGVMHYGSTAFSNNGQSTIKVINDPDGSKTNSLGQRSGMSVVDAQQVNALYQCSHGKFVD